MYGGWGYERKQVQQNADADQQSAYSEKHEEGDWIIPGQGEGFDQEADEYEHSCNSQSRRDFQSVSFHPISHSRTSLRLAFRRYESDRGSLKSDRRSYST